MNKKHFVPLFGTFILWGSMYVVSKIALRSMPPVTLLALRYIVSIPALFVILKLRKKLRPLEKEDVLTIGAIGLMGSFASFCLQMMGISRLTGSLSSLLGAMNPIFIPVLAAIFLKEELTRAKVLSVLISMIGVVTIVGVSGTADPVGVLLMLTSVSWHRPSSVK